MMRECTCHCDLRQVRDSLWCESCGAWYAKDDPASGEAQPVLDVKRTNDESERRRL